MESPANPGRFRDRINLGVERAKVLARAFRCHPAALVFPNGDIEAEIAA